MTMDKLHLRYCELTGFNLSKGYDRERAWYEWAKRFKPEDLDLTVSYLKAEIRKGERKLASLLFRNLIEQLDHFEEELAMAKARARVPKPAPRDTFLASTGRLAPPRLDGAKPISEILPQVWQEGVEQMRKAIQ